ncbi:MAG: GNAT family N-acetyltransferase [Bacteroidetes bacterium]|nr:GNAT family N-acetyltransferase [Bacteroidota bacterium]
MSGPGNIQYLRHKEIDKGKWDKCIGTAPNGLIYAYSFYLDTMSKNWDALVLSKGLHSENDYETVLTLTWNSKYGIRYLYQPFLTAQLGVFGKNVTEQLVADIIGAIPSSFRLIEISMNSGNIFNSHGKLFTLRNNYILDLIKPYNALAEKYSENTRRNIKKAVQSGYTAEKGIAIERIIELAVSQMKIQNNQSADNVNRFRKLYQLLHEKTMTAAYGILLNGELLASAVFFFSHNRAYYILAGNHPGSRNTGTSHMLIDAFINDHAGKNMLLDFEGSDIPGLIIFYSGFGAINEPYPFLRINRLPFYLRWMK